MSLRPAHSHTHLPTTQKAVACGTVNQRMTTDLKQPSSLEGMIRDEGHQSQSYPYYAGFPGILIVTHSKRHSVTCTHTHNHTGHRGKGVTELCLAYVL